MIVNRLASLVLPASSKFMIDDVITQQRHDALRLVALAIGVATIAQAATSFALTRVLSVAAQHLVTELRRQVHRHVVHLPLAFFDRTQSGVLMSRIMSDAEGVQHFIGPGFIALAEGVITALFALGILFYLNWWLTVLILVALAGFGVVMTGQFRRLRPLFRERAQVRGEVMGRLAQCLDGIRVVKAYTAEKREQIVFARGVHRLLKTVVQSMTGVSAARACSILATGVLGMLIVIVGGNEALAGRMTLGDLTMYVVFVALLATPLLQVGAIASELTEAVAGLDRIRELKNIQVEGADRHRTVHAGRIAGELEFDRVTFAFTPGTPVLHDVTFRVPAGSTTALVGPSGSGKSTIIRLMMGFEVPDTGRIVVDGQDLSRVQLASYRAQLGVVLQETFLFEGTVADNIRYGVPHATMDDVRGASRAANCDEFVDRLDIGYDTLVGERGVRLSSGQRQRIGIARALLANPRVLLLDEATSSIDSESEAAVHNALAALCLGRTTIVVAHRLSTIRHADQVCVMESGRIIEQGTHDDLYARKGRYRHLYDLQSHAHTYSGVVTGVH